FSSRRRHTRSKRDWSSDVCSSDLLFRCFLLRGSAGRRGGVQFTGLALFAPQLDAGVVEPFPTEQRALFSGGGVVVFLHDPQLVGGGEGPAFGPVGSGLLVGGLEVVVGHRHRRYCLFSPCLCQLVEFIPWCPTST